MLHVFLMFLFSLFPAPHHAHTFDVTGGGPGTNAATVSATPAPPDGTGGGPGTH